MSKRRTRLAVLPAVLVLALAACGGGDEGTVDAGGTSPDTAASPGTTSPDAMDSPDAMAEGADGPFGPACGAVPADGAGSLDGMSQDPVATAASNNPVLSTLVTAVQEAGLVDTLNSAQDITVFAPTNDAFAALPEDQLNAVLADQELLTSILTYHVVGETVEPEQLGSDGPFDTLQGEQVEATGSGEDFTVGPMDANVVCGNIMTANARVYLIDQVMMPPSTG
jgi:uncharacterized surface protein with fasciclin (FAS1) repeats